MEYYTAKEAMEKLGKPTTTFYREVKEGLIPFTGKKRNMQFPKEAIDAMLEIGAEIEDHKTLSFLPSTNADLWRGLEITESLYGNEDTIPFKRLLEWQKANSEIFMSLKEGDELAGAITFMPIDEETARKLIEGKIRERDITMKNVKKWSERSLTVYVPTIEVVSSGDIRRDRDRGAFLLRRTIKWAITLTIQNDIKNWYGIGATPEGQAILETLGFSKVTELEGGRRNGYILETTREPVRLVSKLLREMEDKKELPEPRNLIIVAPEQD